MNSDNADRSDAGFDDFAHAAGAALRRPAPEDGLAGVRSSRKRRRVVQVVAATGAAAIVVVAGALLVTTNQDDSRGRIASDNSISSGPESSTPGPSTSTSTPTTSTLVDVSGDPLTLTPETAVLWADGVLVAAWVDERFVPADGTTGYPSDMLATPIELIDRTGDSTTWTPETDECGITRLRSADDDQFFGQGYLWSSEYPMSGTLDGASRSESAELDSALSDLGLDPASLDRLVPSADLDGDPDEEVVIVRYDPDTASTDARSAVWLAVWDPGTESITTLAGNPTSDDTHFTALGDGIADLDANGFYDTVVDTGDTVTLIELPTGAVLSTVDTSCSNRAGGEIELRIDGIGPHAFGESQSLVEATLTEAFGQPEILDQLQPAPVVTCIRWGCSKSTVLSWPNAGLLVAFSDRNSDGEALSDPALAGWTLTPDTPWRPGDIHAFDPSSTPMPTPGIRLATDNDIGLGSTVSELRTAFPTTVTGRWNDSSFVPTGFHVPDRAGVTILDGDLDWNVVAELQSALVDDGASLAIDGVAGPDTTAAFTAYRERTGIDDPAAAFEALGITDPPPDTPLVRLSAGDWFWELSCGGLEPHGISSSC